MSRDFWVAGLAMSVSIVHGGPSPQFLAIPLYDAIATDPTEAIVPLDSVPESARKMTLKAVYKP